MKPKILPQATQWTFRRIETAPETRSLLSRDRWAYRTGWTDQSLGLSIRDNPFLTVTCRNEWERAYNAAAKN